MTSNLRFAFEQYLSSEQPCSPPRFMLLSISFQFLWVPAPHPYLFPVFADLACLFLTLLGPSPMLCIKPRIFPLLFCSSFCSLWTVTPTLTLGYSHSICSSTLNLIPIGILTVAGPFTACIYPSMVFSRSESYDFPPSYHLSFHPIYLAVLFRHGMPSGAPISWGKCWFPFRMCIR